MATEADNLYKTQPTIDFPGLGITDRRETPIVDNKLSLTNKMRLQAASVARTAPTERRSGGRRDSVADSLRLLGRLDAENVSTGAVGSVRVGTGAVAAAGNATAPYAMSSGLRSEIYGSPSQAHTGPTAALSTQLHENFHLAMRRVEQKHGRRARLLAAATMIGGMPEGHQNAVRDFAEHRGYDPSHPLFNEEALALLHNYNNNPGERANYHSAYEMTPAAKTFTDRQMKEAYHGARAIAAGIKPEHVAGGEPGIMKAESESDEMCREPGADGSGAVETPAAEVSLVLATDGMGRLLMGKRADNGLWTLPGGAANPNEPPDVTARRELGEETGLQPKSLTLIATSPPHAPGAPLLHIFSAHVTGIPHGRFDPDQECQEWQWIDVRGGIPGNIWDSLHGPDGDDNILRQIFDYKGLEKSEQIWLDAGFMDLRKAIKLTEDEAVPAVKEALTDDLRRPPYQGSPNHDEGHCYVASEALYHLMGGAAAGWTPQHIKHEGAPHWYLKHQSGRILDPTASQFQTPVPYDQGRGMGFLTAVPSARARDVMSRALGELHGGFRKSEDDKFEEALAKMAMIHDDPQTPMTVWRVQSTPNSKVAPFPGHGPYAAVQPVRDAAYRGHYNPIHGYQPSPEYDFTEKDKSAMDQAPEHDRFSEYNGYLFGFESPKHAEDWFGTEALETMKQHGYELTPIPAKKVFRSKSGTQVTFQPLDSHSHSPPGSASPEPTPYTSSETYPHGIPDPHSIVPPGMTKAEPLAKMAMIHDNPDVPMTVWRVQASHHGKNPGQGPYNPDGGVRDLAYRGYEEGGEHQQPPGRSDFSPRETDEMRQSGYPDHLGGYLFGFESPQHAANWFGEDALAEMHERGYGLHPIPAKRVYRGISGKQVVFMPRDSHAHQLDDNPYNGAPEEPTAVPYSPSELHPHGIPALAKATPEFDAWFAGSHIKDASGAPKRVFHGTSKDKDFHTFKIGQRGAWFTTDPNEAGKYAADNDSQNYSYDTGSPVKTNTAARIIPAYLSLKNPHYMTADEMKAINDIAGKSQSAVGYKKPQAAFFQTLRAKGHDGVVMPDGNTFVAFHPTQIKSAYNTKPGAGGHLSKAAPLDSWALAGTPEWSEDEFLHGTPHQFDQFEQRPGHITSMTGQPVSVERQGFFFTKAPHFAQSFAGEGGRVMKTKLDLGSQLDVSNGIPYHDLHHLEDAGVPVHHVDRYSYPLKSGVRAWQMFDGEHAPKVVQGLKNAGYDSVKFTEEDDQGGPVETHVVFHPSQIQQTGHLMKSEPSDAYKMLAHPDPRERAMAIKLGDTTPADLAVAIRDPDPWVWRVAFNHPDAQHALDVLAASSRDAAGVPIYDRHDALLADPRCHDGHLQSMHTAVKDDAEMPIEIRAKRISTLMAHPLGGRLRGEPLKKHWGNRKIKQESSQLQGVVNPSEDVPMEHLGHLAHAYHQHVNGAKPLTPTDAELHETGATSPKVVYKIPVAGHKEDRRFMVKPYSEHGYPLAGWAEGTSQALYHAGQIGHLHQQSFPVSHGTGETVAPGVAIHIENAEPVSKVSFTTIAKKNPEGAEQARRIGLMDFLTGNNDRGTQNMMVRPDRSLLAIDHGQAFQYPQSKSTAYNADLLPDNDGDDFSWFTERQAPMHVYAPDVAKDRLTNPHSKIGDWTSTFNWWGKNSADIRRAFNERLKIIKSPRHAEHLRRHFNARADWLDRQVGVDHATRPWDWHREIVKPPATMTKALGKRDFLFEHSDSPIEVDHDMLQKAHHISNEPKAQEFEKNLNEPAHSIAPTMGHFTGHEPKAVYEHAGHGYLVKPADVEPPRHEHDPDGDAMPVAWNEMTSQGLYHAAGLGDYHNRAHFTMTNPGYRDQDVPPRPALVVHMHPDAMTWEEAKDQDELGIRKAMEPENMRAMRRIGMMDVATGNYDRHTNNIMVRPDGKPIAIDNGFSFNIDHDYGVGKHGSTDPAVVARANVLGRRDESGNMIPYTAGLAIGGQPDEADWAWWDQVKPGILSQMEHHLSMLKSRDHRDAVRHSFHTRVDMMRNLIEPTEADLAAQAAEEAKFEADQVAANGSSWPPSPSEPGTDQTEPVEKPWAGEFPTDRTSYRSSNEGA